MPRKIVPPGGLILTSVRLTRRNRRHWIPEYACVQHRNRTKRNICTRRNGWPKRKYFGQKWDRTISTKQRLRASAATRVLWKLMHESRDTIPSVIRVRLRSRETRKRVICILFERVDYPSTVERETRARSSRYRPRKRRNLRENAKRAKTDKAPPHTQPLPNGAF